VISFGGISSMPEDFDALIDLSVLITSYLVTCLN
jgi:hypothetical protein